ncbi:hypothetical protein QP185_10610 [Sphingomonas aerolata]|uniref:hypothetical protein n=1 Tax=Sphingomonas aerolata TaxID=185951 RepID=UPI002FDF67EB
MDTDLTDDEQVIAKRIHREDEISGWAGFSLALLFLAGAAILAWQRLVWLKAGEWTSYTWADAFAWAGPLELPNGRGVEKLLRWIGQLPLCLLPVAIAFAVGGLWFHDKQDDLNTRCVRMKIANAKYWKATGSEK